MDVLKLLTYASGVVFVVAFAVKLIKYATMPMHVRWELYPVPHEGKAYGGSFYEDMDHWTKDKTQEPHGSVQIHGAGDPFHPRPL